MSNLVRYPNRNLFSRDPFALARELFGNDVARRSEPVAGFAARFDVKETEAAYVISADLPGIKDADLDISLDGNQLTISGSRSSETVDEGETYFISERSYGSFSRSFVLPDEADSSAVDAQLNAGVLSVTISKKPQAQPKKITVNGN